MPNSLRTNACLAIVALVALTDAKARADDLIVMPFSCAVVEGQPVLSRARDEGHRILGPREQRNFKACSTVNPELCRQWTVYRFDLDCGGVRMPWVSVVAAAARRQRSDRMWIEDGRLRLNMGAQWGMAPNDPCARGFAYDGFAHDDRWRGGRLQRYCSDRRELSDSGASIVDMPPGFAPMLNIDGFFVDGSARNTASAPWTASPSGASPPAFKGAGADGYPPPSIPEPAAKGWRPEVAAPAMPVEPPAKSARTESPPAPPSPPEPAKGSRLASIPSGAPPEPAAKATGGQDAATSARPPPPPAPANKQAEAKPLPAPAPEPAAPATVPGGPVIPKIINRPTPPPAEPAAAPAPPETVVSKSASVPEAAPRVAAIPPARPKETVQDNPVEKAAARKDEAAPASIFSAMPNPTAMAGAAVCILALFMLTLFVFTRRRERVQFAGAPRRDIAAVSLDGRAVGTPLPTAPAEGEEDVWTQDETSASLQPSAQKASMPSSWSDRIPRNRDEALQVLGMGVSADANLNAIKKIVDGLRASWHPDHASGQADRQLRELRMKQINAAWEIIAGKRAAM